jgi:hypothetical protein
MLKGATCPWNVSGRRLEIMSGSSDLKVGKRERPVAICARCLTPYRAFEHVGRRCSKILPGERRCPGVVRTAIEREEWLECPACAAGGAVGDAPCARCSGEGWIYLGRALWDPE